LGDCGDLSFISEKYLAAVSTMQDQKIDDNDDDCDIIETIYEAFDFYKVDY